MDRPKGRLSWGSKGEGERAQALWEIPRTAKAAHPSHPKPKHRLCTPFLGRSPWRKQEGDRDGSCPRHHPPVKALSLPRSGAARHRRAGRREASQASRPGSRPRSSRAVRWRCACRVTRPRALAGRSAAAGRAPGDLLTYPASPPLESRAPGSRLGARRSGPRAACPAPSAPGARRRALPLPCPVHGGVRSIVPPLP